MTLTKTGRRIAIGAAVVVLAVLLAVGGFLWWALTPYGPDDDALAALESDEFVIVEQTDAAWVFTPTDEKPHVGLVIYPGGRVDARAYAPLAREISEMGYLVAVPPMPLNLAVLAPGTARDVMDANPGIVTWAVGGHSLGGSMAARFANENRGDVSGLALIASYPASSDDMADVGFDVVSIYGSRDGVLDEESFSEAVPLLPSVTRYIAIDGGNHAQFGNYGPQAGDRDAAIKPEDQRWQTVTAIGEMLIPLRHRAQ